MKKIFKFNYIMFLLVALLTLIDHIIKYLVVEHLMSIPTYPLWEDVFHLTYVENRGAAFGMFSGMSFILIGMTSFLLILLSVILFTGRIFKHIITSKFLFFTLALIIGGGLGNLLDRIFRGYVVDYLDFRLINFAVFNFADCCAVIGTIFLLYYFMFIDKEILADDKKVVSSKENESIEGKKDE